MGKGNKKRNNRNHQQEYQFQASGQNARQLDSEQSHSSSLMSTHNKRILSSQLLEQNTAGENSRTELNVPRQQNHKSSQNMNAVGNGHQSNECDDRAQSQSGIQQDVTDQRTADTYHSTSRNADSHHYTNRDRQNEYNDNSTDVSQFGKSGRQNYKHECEPKNLDDGNRNLGTWQNSMFMKTEDSWHEWNCHGSNHLEDGRQWQGSCKGGRCQDQWQGSREGGRCQGRHQWQGSREGGRCQGRHQWQGSREGARYQGNHWHNQNSHHYENANQEPKPEAKGGTKTMKCIVCTFAYNDKDCKPRSLQCGHSICSSCCPKLIQQTCISCPYCRQNTKGVNTVETLPVNYSLLEVLEELSLNSAVAINSTPGSKSQAGNRSTLKASAPELENSPHCSRCFEFGATVDAYCVTCEQWVCTECGRIDHGSNECILTPYKETLSEMEQAKKSMAQNAHQSLKKSLSETVNYCHRLMACLITLETTQDCIKKEQKRFDKILEESKQVEAHLQSTVANMPTAKTLSEKLSIFKKVDDSVCSTQQWASNVMSSHMDDTVKKLSKELVCTTVQIHSASTDNGSTGGVLAMHIINNKNMFSKLVPENGRIHVYSLVQITPPSRSRALPLESIKFCIDSASALTFLDLSWGGSYHGRVYIRLIGDTMRGRQFLIMCTGEEGPSFRSTHFHRVWWKGLPGEHVWGGDYDQSNGSEVKQVKNADGNEMPCASGRKLSITAGLVAGRYEKKDLSTIFRIFTKDATDVEEEAAFGRVEYGLHIIDAAIMHDNIQDVIISACGIVIES